MTEYFETCSKKGGRGMGQRSLALIEEMRDIAEAAQPITGRGVGYKLFTAKLIPSMARSEMQRVYRLLKMAREQGTIPWESIVDETRDLERVSTWDNPKNTPAVSRDPTAGISGTSSQSAVRCGARRAQCAVCCSRCSITTRWAFACCTDLAAPRRSTTCANKTVISVT